MKCPRCGKELTAAAPEGLCPNCLGALNFATDTAIPDADAKETLPPLTPAELAPHFPQLEILECLGRGGMGVVYKARQKSLNRFVALKLLAPERVQDAKFAERFAREAHALAALNHPNIVTVHDFGQAGGYYFLLMEFVDGVNLRQLLRSRKLQPSEALAIVPPICEALQYAHEHGIVHRDIKPENLLLAKDGRVKIADFGIAKMLGTDGTPPSLPLSSPRRGEGQGEEALGTSVTQHTTMGTPQYMAPEQRDQSQSADHRADIYSLGVVLYELLTGELPADKLQPPSRVRGVQIDVRVDEIVLRALEKTPELRYQTAGEFKTQVESVATGAKSPSSAPSASLKQARGRFTSPEFLSTPVGGFRKHQGIGELSLHADHLIFAFGERRTRISFDALRLLGTARGPRWTSPAGHHYLSLVYEETGQRRQLLFMAGEGFIKLAEDTARTAEEWIAAIQAAVLQSGRKAVPVVEGGPVVVAASPWLAALILGPTFLLAMFPWLLTSLLSPQPNRAQDPHPWIQFVPVLTLLVGGAAVMLFSSVRQRQRSAQSNTADQARSAKSNHLGKVLFTGGIILIVTLMCAVSLTQSNTKKQAAETQPQAVIESPRLQPAAVRTIISPPFIAHLPYGGSVELLAVRLHPQSTSQPWWQPDGSPSRYGADITMEGQNDVGSGVFGLVKVRWPEAPPHNEPYGVSFNGGRFALKNGLRLPLEDFRVIHFERVTVNGDEATLTVPVAVQEWETVMTLKPGLGDYLTSGAARRQWDFSETPNGNLKVSIKKLPRQEGMEYQLVAMDKAGAYRTSSMAKTTTSAGNSDSEYEAHFDAIGSGTSGLKADEVKEVYWQQRPYESVEFRHVSLKAGHLTKLEARDFGTDTAVAQTTNVLSEQSSPVAAANSLLASNQTPREAFLRIVTWRIVVLVLLVGLFIGSVVLVVWLTRKQGMKGCLLAGLILLGASVILFGVAAVVAYSFRAQATRLVSQPVTRFEMESINQQPVPSVPNGLAMQVQNGLNVRVPGGQLATFEFYMRQADDTLELVPALTAVIATSPSGGFNGSVFWQGKRGDEARNTNQLWFWSVNGHTLGGQPLPSRPDYETTVTYHLRRDELLNWWQLNIPSLTTMSLGETRDIPIFRTFGTATVHGDQPKEAIVRVKCEPLPAGFKLLEKQYELRLGAENNKPDEKVETEGKTTALPRNLVPQSVVDEARAQAKRTEALHAEARITRSEVLDAEYHLKWAEAMFNGDIHSALQAKRDGTALKLEGIDSLLKTGRVSNTDRAKVVRELAEAEAALRQWDLKETK